MGRKILEKSGRKTEIKELSQTKINLRLCGRKKKKRNRKLLKISAEISWYLKNYRHKHSRTKRSAQYQKQRAHFETSSLAVDGFLLSPEKSVPHLHWHQHYRPIPPPLCHLPGCPVESQTVFSCTCQMYSHHQAVPHPCFKTKQAQLFSQLPNCSSGGAALISGSSKSR